MVRPYVGVPYSDLDTSLEAARSYAEHASTDSTRVLRVIRFLGDHGATDDEIEQALGMPHQTASARRRDLVIAGMVVDSGLRRRTRSGRNAKVWIVATDGVQPALELQTKGPKKRLTSLIRGMSETEAHSLIRHLETLRRRQ
jgi:transcription initiation factor IIE alpha subunit